MACGQRKSQWQDELWIASDEIARGSDRQFDRSLNAIFDEAGIDRRVKGRCKQSYTKDGRRAFQPGCTCAC